MGSYNQMYYEKDVDSLSKKKKIVIAADTV
jgi:hypothetical protein